MPNLRHALTAVLLSLACVSLTGCSLIDPTYGMTPEEKAAYHAEQERLDALYAARNIQDLTTPGEPHDEPHDAALAGRYVAEVEGPWMSYFVNNWALGRRHKVERLSLFDNGSFAYRLEVDKRWGEDSKERDWSMDMSGQGKVRRGQWKTEGGTLWVRDLTKSDYYPWREWGSYERSGGGFGLVDKRSIESKTRDLPEDAEAFQALQAVAEYTWSWAREG